MEMSEVEETTIDKLTLDDRNANEGTERGRYMLDYSLRQFGAGRSILVDKNGKVIAGNKTVETAADIGLEDVIIVRTKGDKLVAVLREDLDLDDGDQARLLAYADNRTSETGFEIDVGVLEFDLGEGLDLSALYKPDELEEMVSTRLGDAGDPTGRSLGDVEKQIKPVLYVSDISIFERAIRKTGMKNRGQAVIEICRAYLGENEEGQFNFSFENPLAG